MGKLHVDLFLEDRFLINGVSVNIRFVKRKDTFASVTTGATHNHKVHIVDATMIARVAARDLPSKIRTLRHLTKV